MFDYYCRLSSTCYSITRFNEGMKPFVISGIYSKTELDIIYDLIYGICIIRKMKSKKSLYDLTFYDIIFKRVEIFRNSMIYMAYEEERKKCRCSICHVITTIMEDVVVDDQTSKPIVNWQIDS